MKFTMTDIDISEVSHRVKDGWARTRLSFHCDELVSLGEEGGVVALDVRTKEDSPWRRILPGQKLRITVEVV